MYREDASSAKKVQIRPKKAGKKKEGLTKSLMLVETDINRFVVCR